MTLVCAVLVNILVMLFQISFATELLGTHGAEEIVVLVLCLQDTVIDIILCV